MCRLFLSTVMTLQEVQKKQPQCSPLSWCCRYGRRSIGGTRLITGSHLHLYFIEALQASHRLNFMPINVFIKSFSWLLVIFVIKSGTQSISFTWLFTGIYFHQPIYYCFVLMFIIFFYFSLIVSVSVNHCCSLLRPLLLVMWKLPTYCSLAHIFSLPV